MFYVWVSRLDVVLNVFGVPVEEVGSEGSVGTKLVSISSSSSKMLSGLASLMILRPFLESIYCSSTIGVLGCIFSLSRGRILNPSQ